MATMKLEEIRGKDSRELRLDLQAARKELFRLRFRGASDEISDTSRFRNLRKTIARIHTVLRERDLAAANAGGAGDASGNAD